MGEGRGGDLLLRRGEGEGREERGGSVSPPKPNFAHGRRLTDSDADGCYARLAMLCW